MMTFSSNTQRIEAYLDGKLQSTEIMIFRASLILNRRLREDLYFQRKTRQLVKIYHRKKLKEELGILHGKIFSESVYNEFQRKVYSIFK